MVSHDSTAAARAELARGMHDAIDSITIERHRQVQMEGYTRGDDDRYVRGQLAAAAAAYALPMGFRPPPSCEYPDGQMPFWWPWGRFFWKPTPNDRRRELVKAGALIVAEIERLDRLSARDPRGR